MNFFKNNNENKKYCLEVIILIAESKVGIDMRTYFEKDIKFIFFKVLRIINE